MPALLLPACPTLDDLCSLLAADRRDLASHDLGYSEVLAFPGRTSEDHTDERNGALIAEEQERHGMLVTFLSDASLPVPYYVAFL